MVWFVTLRLELWWISLSKPKGLWKFVLWFCGLISMWDMEPGNCIMGVLGLPLALQTPSLRFFLSFFIILPAMAKSWDIQIGFLWATSTQLSFSWIQVMGHNRLTRTFHGAIVTFAWRYCLCNVIFDWGTATVGVLTPGSRIRWYKYSTCIWWFHYFYMRNTTVLYCHL
jgi:hypothetical protein